MRRTRKMKASSQAMALLLAGGMALAACASDEPTSTGGSGASESEGGAGAEDLKIGLAYDAVGRGDRSFNDSAFAGAEAAVEEFGGEYREVTPNEDGSDRAELLAQLAEQGYNPVIAVGFAYDQVLPEVAADFPDTTFAQVDGRVDVPEYKGDNVTGLIFAEEQGSFLAGAAAALKTESDKIGFVGGVETSLIKKFQAGYEAGAKEVNPDIEITSQYLAPDGDFTGFNAPDKAEQVAGAMYEDGADIVYHASGGSGTGVFEAAAANEGWAIGVDSDQYETVGDPNLQKVILTSMLKRVDNAVESFIASYVDGSVEGGTDIAYDLESGGIDLAETGGFIEDIKGDIDGYRQQIVDGEIEVPTTPGS